MPLGCWERLNAIAHFRIDDFAYAFLAQVFELCGSNFPRIALD